MHLYLTKISLVKTHKNLTMPTIAYFNQYENASETTIFKLVMLTNISYCIVNRDIYFQWRRQLDK